MFSIRKKSDVRKKNKGSIRFRENASTRVLSRSGLTQR